MQSFFQAKIKKFIRDDKFVFINPDVPSWIVTNRNGDVLLSLLKNGFSEEEIIDQFKESHGPKVAKKVASFIRYCSYVGLFSTPSNEEVPIKRSFGKLDLVQFSISSNCNLNCRYCYAADRNEGLHPQMCLDDYKRVVDDILTLSRNTKFTITGGEPLLNKDCVDIAYYIRSKGNFVDLLTNGTLINTSNIVRIRDVFDRVTLSLDGSTKNKHDFFRGSGSYDRLQKAIYLLEENGVNYELSMTVNKFNISDIENVAAQFGGRLHFAPLFPAGNANKSEVDLSINGRQYYEALNSAKNVSPLSFCESALENAKHCRACKCAVGTQELSISATGDVYPCQLLHYPDFLIGNIHDTPISELWRNSPLIEKLTHLTVDNIDGCRDCAFKYICGGACRARAYHECGRVDVSGEFCEYEKEALLQGIINYYSENVL